MLRYSLTIRGCPSFFAHHGRKQTPIVLSPLPDGLSLWRSFKLLTLMHPAKFGLETHITSNVDGGHDVNNTRGTAPHNLQNVPVILERHTMVTLDEHCKHQNGSSLLPVKMCVRGWLVGGFHATM